MGPEIQMFKECVTWPYLVLTGGKNETGSEYIYGWSSGHVI
jgi:hypothetical protein